MKEKMSRVLGILLLLGGGIRPAFSLDRAADRQGISQGRSGRSAAGLDRALVRKDWTQDFSLTQSSSSRLDAVKAVFQGKHPRAAKSLRAAFLQEPRASIRVWMIRAENHVSPGHLKFLSAALKDPSVFVREAAVVALGESKKSQSAQILAALLPSEPDSGARMTICFWLGQLGGSQAVAALSQVLSADKDPNVRLQAAQSLKKIGTGSALSALRQAAKDPNARVREAAR